MFETFRANIISQIFIYRTCWSQTYSLHSTFSANVGPS